MPSLIQQFNQNLFTGVHDWPLGVRVARVLPSADHHLVVKAAEELGRRDSRMESPGLIQSQGHRPKACGGVRGERGA